MDAGSDMMISKRVTSQRSPRACPRAGGMRKRVLCFNLIVMLTGALAFQGFGQPAEQTKPTSPANPAQPAAPASPAPANAPPVQTPAVTPKLNNPAADALRVQAEAGNALAQFKLGMLFASG